MVLEKTARTWPEKPSVASSPLAFSPTCLARQVRGLVFIFKLVWLTNHALNQPAHFAQVLQRPYFAGLYPFHAFIILDRTGEDMFLTADKVLLGGIYQPYRVRGHSRAKRCDGEIVAGQDRK